MVFPGQVSQRRRNLGCLVQSWTHLFLMSVKVSLACFDFKSLSHVAVFKTGVLLGYVMLHGFKEKQEKKPQVISFFTFRFLQREWHVLNKRSCRENNWLRMIKRRPLPSIKTMEFGIWNVLGGYLSLRTKTMLLMNIFTDCDYRHQRLCISGTVCKTSNMFNIK